MKKRILIAIVILILGVCSYMYLQNAKLPAGESKWISVSDENVNIEFKDEKLCKLEYAYYGIHISCYYEYDKSTKQGVIQVEGDETSEEVWNLFFELKNVGNYEVLVCWDEELEYKEVYYQEGKENIAYTIEYGKLKKEIATEEKEELLIGEEYTVSEELFFTIDDISYDPYDEDIVVNMSLYNNATEERVCGYAESSTYFDGLNFGVLGPASQGSSTLYVGWNEFFMGFPTSFNEALSGEVEEPPYSENYFWAIGEISIDEKEYWIDITDQVIEKYEGIEYSNDDGNEIDDTNEIDDEDGINYELIINTLGSFPYDSYILEDDAIGLFENCGWKKVEISMGDDDFYYLDAKKGNMKLEVQNSESDEWGAANFVGIYLECKDEDVLETFEACKEILFNYLDEPYWSNDVRYCYTDGLGDYQVFYYEGGITISRTYPSPNLN